LSAILFAAVWLVTFGILARLRSKRPMTLQRRRLKSGSRLAAAPAIPTEPVEVGRILSEVLHRSEPELAGSLGRLKFAVADGLRVHLAPLALHRILSQLIATARLIGQSGEVLLTARSDDGCIEISAVIDRPIGSAAAVDRAITDTETVAALHGGTVEIDPKSDRTILRVRLLKPADPSPGRGCEAIGS